MGSLAAAEPAEEKVQVQVCVEHAGQACYGKIGVVPLSAWHIHRALSAVGQVRLLSSQDFTTKVTADASLKRQRTAQQDALTNIDTDLIASLVRLRGAGGSAKTQRRDA